MYFVFVTNDLEAVGVFERVLHESGAKKNLLIAPNGYDLIQLLQNVKKGEPYPDLIILTPKFLRISGIDLLELLKTDDFYRLIPVVMLLPESNDDYQAVCIRLNAEYMPFPKDKNEWVQAIDRMCAACS
jgi:CheY-like chemotaxis protein